MAGCVCVCPQRGFACASVACHSILVATTVQPAQLRGFWDGGDLQWNVRGTSVEKQAPGSLSLSGSRTWISPVWTLWTIVGCRSWQMVCRSSSARSWPSTRHSRRFWGAMFHPREDLPTQMAARRPKETTHPELTGQNGRTELVVLGCEVGGRWSEEAPGVPPRVGQGKGQR